MTCTVDLPRFSVLPADSRPTDVARCVLRLKLTRAYEGRRLTSGELKFVRLARDYLRHFESSTTFSGGRQSITVVELQIANLYDEIALLDAMPPSPATTAERMGKLARLRELQRAEADRSERWFNTHQEFDPAAARDALRRAEELIARHARPS